MVLYMWLEVAKDKTTILEHRYIKLEADKTIVWGQEYSPCGFWKYIFTECGVGIYLMEFSARKSRHKRKHILKQINDNAFILLPVTEAACLYDDPRLWDPSSYNHSNENTIIMQKVVVDVLDVCLQLLPARSFSRL